MVKIRTYSILNKLLPKASMKWLWAFVFFFSSFFEFLVGAIVILNRLRAKF